MVFRRLVKDSVIYGGADFITKILYFIAFPIIAAVLSPKAFGALELIFTVTSLLGLVVSCGLNNAVQRFYWDKETTAAQQSSVVTSGFAAQLIFGLFAVLFGLLFVPFVVSWALIEELPLTWVALVAALMVMTLSQWLQYVLDVIRLHAAPWRFFTVALVSRVLTMAFGLVAIVFLGLGVDGLLAAQAIVLMAVIPLALWLIRRDISLSQFDFGWVKQLVRFGYPFIFTGVAYWLFGSMDRWMLASMASVEEVGIYSVAFRFASVVLFVSSAFGQAWSPVAIKIRTDHPDEYRAIYGKVLLLLVFIMLIVGGGLALFAGEIVSQFMPKEYLPSATSLAILCFGIVLQATQQITAVGISIEKKTYLFARLASVAAVINFLGNWILIPHFGAAGAAWSTFISYVFLTVSYTTYTQRLHPLVLEWGRLGMFIGLGAIVGFLSISMMAYDLDWATVLTKIIVFVAFFIIGWRLLPLHSFRKI